MKIEQQREIDDLNTIMDLPAGRRFIWRLLSGVNGRQGAYSRTFVAGAVDLTAFNEGERSVATGLLTEILAVCPTKYLTMQKEAINAEEYGRNERKRKRKNVPGDDGYGGADN